MEPFFEFDDGLFHSTVQKEVQEQSFISAPLEPKWFLNPSEQHRAAYDDHAITKHKADYCYLKQDYRNAVKYYEQLLSMLPASNTVCRREYLENVARCYSCMNEYCTSLKYEKILMETSKTVEQFTVSLSCMLDLTLKSSRFKEGMLYCMKLITIHKYSSYHWLKLSYTFSQLFTIDLPQTLKLQKSSIHNKQCSCQDLQCNIVGGDEIKNCDYILKRDEQTKHNIVLFCLLMVKCILDSTCNTAIGFALVDINTWSECVEHDIQSIKLNVNEAVYDLLHAVVTKLVFGYVRTNVGVTDLEFIDRGSSKYKNEISSSITCASLLSMTCKCFADNWFNSFLENIDKET